MKADVLEACTIDFLLPAFKDIYRNRDGVLWTQIRNFRCTLSKLKNEMAVLV